MSELSVIKDDLFSLPGFPDRDSAGVFTREGSPIYEALGSKAGEMSRAITSDAC